jgi:hypothetical protein
MVAAVARFARQPVHAATAVLFLALALPIAAALVLLDQVKAVAAPHGRPEAAARMVRTTTGPPPCTELTLAAALVDALNQSDEDAVVGLFDPEATLRLDRYA